MTSAPSDGYYVGYDGRVNHANPYQLENNELVILAQLNFWGGRVSTQIVKEIDRRNLGAEMNALIHAEMFVPNH